MSQPEREQAEQNDNKTEVLSDLEPSAEQAAETKAGGPGSGGGQGKVSFQDMTFTTAVNKQAF